MKKIVSAAFISILLSACGSAEMEKEIESLHEELIVGHDEVMPLSMQLPKLSEKVSAKVSETSRADSIETAKSISSELIRANEAMYTWMDQFAEAMQTEDFEKKITEYKRLKEEIEAINKNTHQAMDDAKAFVNEK